MDFLVLLPGKIGLIQEQNDVTESPVRSTTAFGEA